MSARKKAVPASRDEFGLNDKQRKFADLCVNGMSALSAYKKAGYSERSAASCATRLRENARVCEYIARIQQKAAQETGDSVEKRRRVLMQIYESPDTKAGDKVRAIAELNKMGGDYAPIRAEVVTVDVVDFIKSGRRVVGIE